MGDLVGPLRAPSPMMGPSIGGLPPVPDVTLPRPSILGPSEGAATLDGFATGSATLTASHQAQIVVLAMTYQQLLANSPAGTIKAVGHTDRIGSDADNDELGQERADAVLAELVSQGIDTGSIDAHSLGESVPAVETDEANAANRRVELYFQPGPGLNLQGVFTDGLTFPPALGATGPGATGGIPSPDGAPGSVPNLHPSTLDMCTIAPQYCLTPEQQFGPRRPPPSGPNPLTMRVPPLPDRSLPSVSDAIWGPIDRSLERGLRGLGLSDTWNERLRDLARAGVGKLGDEVLDRALDAANLQGQTRSAAESLLRGAIQLEIPLR